MSTLADSLARLRRQAGATGSVPGAPVIPPVADPALRALLQRRLRPVVRSRDRALPGTEIAPGLQYCESRCQLPHDPVESLDLAPALRAGEGFAVVPRQLLCFDTETTGLAGGTGTRAFMIGVADFDGEALRVRQLTLAALSAESAMLEVFAGWLAPDTVLLSYNGKCFDAPLLATRYRLARRRNPLAGLAHVDLLHAVRRRWRGVWPDCRLATVERELLRIVREDDLPGSQAPQAFLTYLRGGAAADLRRVHAHNRQDVVTLAALLERLVLPGGGER